MGKVKTLTEQEKKELLDLKPEEYTLDKIKELLAYFEVTGRKYNPADQVVLKANEYYNRTSITTTVGRIIFNKVVLDPDIIKHTGYINISMDEDAIGDLESELANNLLNGNITIQNYSDYIDKINWLGYGCNNFLAASLNVDLYIEPKKVTDKKRELLEKHKEELDAGNLTVITEIEKELLAIAKEENKENPAMEIFESGARGSFNNNYKNSVIIRGAVLSPVDRSVSISTTSLVEGITKEDYDVYANMIVAASFNRAKNTEKGGYTGKKLHYAFQHMALDEQGSDCGTKKTIEITLDKFNSKLCMYRYIVDGGKLILLDPETMEKYKGKTVKMRSPMYCTSDDFCNMCAGDLYYRLGIKNVGLLMNRQGTSLMQMSMKLFHDTTVRLSEINIEDYVSEIK